MNILDTIIDKKSLRLKKEKSKQALLNWRKGPFFKNETLSFKNFYQIKTGQA